MDDRVQLLGRLIGGVAHELSNHLWVADLSLLRVERHAGDELLIGCARTGREATQRALALSECLVAYVRGGTPAPTSLDLGQLAQRALALFQAIIPDGVEVRLRTDEPVAQIEGVAPALEQLLLSLVLQACDATPVGGAVEVAVRGEGTMVLLEVAHGGAPSPALGLGLVRDIAARHRAGLEVIARPGGTSFVVGFPARRAR